MLPGGGNQGPHSEKQARNMADEPEIDFGTFLRKARERRGMSLQQVAATTKISARVLGALEQNDPSKLPGGIFARAFVRAYAREVGLDPEATVARFVAEFPDSASGEEHPKAAKGDDAESFESGRRVAMTVLQLAGISVLIVIAILVYLKTRPSPAVPAEPPAERSDRQAPVSSVPRSADVAPPQNAAPVEPGPVPAAGTSSEPGAASGVPEPSAQSGAPLSLLIVAVDPCWVSLTTDGREVISRLLEAGERVTFDAQTSMTLKAGNAGALQLTLNGRRGLPFGEPGQVVTKTITPATLASFIER